VWLDAGTLREPRNATHAVPVGTGEVLVVGSDYLTSWLSACGASTNGSDSVELGDPVTGAWDTTTSLPSLRDAPVVVGLPDGRALVTGGAAGEDVGWSAYSSTYLFDPTSRRWSRSGLMNTARTATAATVLLDGRVLVAGGQFLDRAAPEQARALDSSEVWDPRSGAWSRTRRLAMTRIGASAVTLADGRVLIVGGSVSRESAPIEQASAEVYDPDSGRWISAGTLATARSGFALVALEDGGAIVAGGFGGQGTDARASLSSVERFDPVSSMWSSADDLPVPVAGAAGIRLDDGRVLLAGGSVHEAELIDADAGTFTSGLTADASVFDPQTGTWTATTPMPSPRAGAAVVLLADGSALFLGGSLSEGSPADTPGCPEAEPRVVRYLPGS
jgi:N-acetylneuraminic acid mutarotase